MRPFERNEAAFKSLGISTREYVALEQLAAGTDQLAAFACAGFTRCRRCCNH